MFIGHFVTHKTHITDNTEIEMCNATVGGSPHHQCATSTRMMRQQP